MRSYRIGRGRGNDIIVKDASVSREHAELRIGEGDEYLLVDLESTNGTCVREDGRWVEIERAAVKKTERILLGEVITSVGTLVDKAVRRQAAFTPAEDMARRVRQEPSLPLSAAAGDRHSPEPAFTHSADRPDPDLGPPGAAWPSSRRVAAQISDPPVEVSPPPREPAPSKGLDKPLADGVPPHPPETQDRKRRGHRRWAAFAVLVLLLGAGAAYGYMKFREVIAADSAPAASSAAVGEEMLAPGETGDDRAGRETPETAGPAADESGSAAVELPRPSMTRAAAGETWQQILSGPGRQTIHSAVPGSGGVYAVGSAEAANGSGEPDGQRLWVARFSAAGAPLWQNVYGEDGSTAGASAYPMDDRGALVAGHRETGSGRRLPWVARLDAEGNVLWQRTLGQLHSGVATYVTGIPGGYVVAAAISREADGPAAARLVKFDENGRVLWRLTFDDGLTWPTGLRRARDGGIVVAGVNKARPEDTYVLWAARVDNNGAVRWANRYARAAGEDGTALVRRAAGDEYIIVATHTRHDGDRRSVDLRFVRLSPDGRVIWRYLHETAAPERAAGLILVPGGIIVAGNTENQTAGGRDLLVARFDTRGRVVWQRRYGGSRDDWATDLRQTRDRGLLVAGITESHGGGRDGWVLRLNGEGQLAD